MPRKGRSNLGKKPVTPRKSTTKAIKVEGGTKSKTIKKSSTQPSRFAPLGKRGINF